MQDGLLTGQDVAGSQNEGGCDCRAGSACLSTAGEQACQRGGISNAGAADGLACKGPTGGLSSGMLAGLALRRSHAPTSWLPKVAPRQESTCPQST